MALGAGYPPSIDSSQVEVLVVEDSPTQALCLQRTLELAGYHVSIAHDGRQAMDYLEGHTPTLVVSDIMMPGFDGYELCRLIKNDERLRGVPVILVTALTDPVDILRGLQCGADNFITKPYQEKELLSRIQYLLINTDLRKQSAAGLVMEIFFAGRKHFLTPERMQIVDLLLSSFETAVMNKCEFENANKELRAVNDRLTLEIAERKRAEEERERLIQELQRALAEVKRLSGLLPICASCKRIRDDRGYWRQIEAYISDHSEADFSHGICPECAKKLYPDFDLEDKG